MGDYTPYDAYTMRKCIERQDAAIAELRRENKLFRDAEKELSDAYLRIRKLVGAWNTNFGGENRYQVTEDAIKDLRTRLDAAEGKVEKAKEWLARSIINYCPECSLEIDIIDWDALEQILEDK